MSKTTLPKLPFAGATQTIEELDRDRDGKIDFKKTTSNTYDKQGNLIKSVSKVDSAFRTPSGSTLDGKIDEIVTIGNTYNKQGKLVNSVTEFDENADGKIDFKRIIKNTYDNQGNLTSTVIGANPAQTISNTYDKQGNLIKSVNDSGFGDFLITTTTNTYNNRGKVTSSILESAITGLNSGRFKATTSNTYDKQGNLTRAVVESDFNLDGKTDSLDTTVNTYNKQGKVTFSVVESDFLAPNGKYQNNRLVDGKIDSRTSITNTYDKQGNLTRSISKDDFDADGKIDSIETVNNTYNKQGNLTRSVTENSDGNGIVKSKDTITGTYSSRDLLCGVGLSSDKFDKLTNYRKVMLVGGKGNDFVMGTAKADTLKGGAGKDIFMLAANSGNDTIADFKKGIDVIGLSKGIGFSQLSFNGNKISYQGQDLATLTGIQTSTLSASDFLPI